MPYITECSLLHLEESIHVRTPRQHLRLSKRTIVNHCLALVWMPLLWRI